MREFSANLSSASSSPNEISLRIALSAKARYMAPLSRFVYPSLRARRDAIVLFPAPAGPSMAIINRRGESFIDRQAIVHAGLFSIREVARACLCPYFRRGLEQATGVGIAGLLRNLLCWPNLHDLPSIHHGDACCQV